MKLIKEALIELDKSLFHFFCFQKKLFYFKILLRGNFPFALWFNNIYSKNKKVEILYKNFFKGWNAL